MDLQFLLLKIKLRVFPSLFTSEDMVSYLKKQNIRIGKGTIFYHPGYTTVDTSRPCLLQIGEYCKITSGVIILTHDYSRSVLRRAYGDIVGEADKTVIGDNVFIGMNSIILMGSKIGSNVIIGAGSVVSGKIPDNVVVAGNPARVIRTLDEHYRYKKEHMRSDAMLYTSEFEKHNGRLPTVTELDPFYPLFMPRDIGELKAHNLRTNLGGDNEAEVLEAFMNSKPIFNGYDEFISHYKEKVNDKSNL